MAASSIRQIVLVPDIRQCTVKVLNIDCIVQRYSDMRSVNDVETSNLSTNSWSEYGHKICAEKTQFTLLFVKCAFEKKYLKK